MSTWAIVLLALVVPFGIILCTAPLWLNPFSNDRDLSLERLVLAIYGVK